MSRKKGSGSAGYVLGRGFDLHDIGPDDERFLMLRQARLSGDTGGDSRYVLVQNFFEVLRQRLGN